MMFHSGRRNAAAVTPSDTVNMIEASSVYVGVSGDISIVTPNGQSVLLKSVAVGMLDVPVSRVNATGTTATNMIAFY